MSDLIQDGDTAWDLHEMLFAHNDWGDLRPNAEAAKYQRMLRKDVRIRADQDEMLTRLTRRLSARRQDRSERITTNTLIRVALDLLAASVDRLSGDTEEQLRRSALGTRS
jgi:hypothetical protein